MRKLYSLVAFAVLGISCTETAEPAPTTVSDIFTTDTTQITQATESKRCDSLEAKSIGTVNDSSLNEISGAAWTSEGLWVHNDSGQSSTLYLVGAPGTDQVGQVLRRIDLNIELDDPEDISLAGTSLVLADIGDNFNTEPRDNIELIRVDPVTGLVSERSTYTYPGNSVDAEAMLVDPLSNQVVVIEKSLGLASLFGLTPPAAVFTANLGEGGELTKSGEIDLQTLSDRSTGAEPEGLAGSIPGAVTAADISADGGLIAVRTYESLWLYSRSSDQSVSEALQGSPCEVSTVPETQGESVAISPSGNELVTIGEGSNPSVNFISG